MTLESRFSGYLIGGLRKQNFIMRRMENELGSGTPDVNWLIDGKEGWIELKRIGSWPARRDTSLRLHHFTRNQKSWAAKQLCFGGRWALFLKVSSDYFLFTTNLGILVGEDKKNKEWMMKNCCGHWEKRLDFKEVKMLLTTGKV